MTAKAEREIRASMTSEQIQLERKLTCEAIDGAIAFGYQNTNPPPSDEHWLAAFWKIGRKQAELEAASALDRLTAEQERLGLYQGPVARYIVIGYGEADNPQAAFVNEREQLLDAVLGMIYTHPTDACNETREEYRQDLADDDEWSEGIWRTEFEIGGIVVYDLGTAVPNPSSKQEPVALTREQRQAIEYMLMYGPMQTHMKVALDELLNAAPRFVTVSEDSGDAQQAYDAGYQHGIAEPSGYTTAMGEAAETYFAQFKDAHPLPAQFRWSDLYEHIIRATPSAKQEPMADGRTTFLVYWCEDVPEYLREKWKVSVDEALREGRANDKLIGAWEAWQARAKLDAPQSVMSEDSGESGAQADALRLAAKPFVDAFERSHLRSYEGADEAFTAFLDRNTVTPTMTVGDFRLLHDAIKQQDAQSG